MGFEASLYSTFKWTRWTIVHKPGPARSGLSGWLGELIAKDGRGRHYPRESHFISHSKRHWFLETCSLSNAHVHSRVFDFLITEYVTYRQLGAEGLYPSRAPRSQRRLALPLNKWHFLFPLGQPSSNDSRKTHDRFILWNYW